MDTRTHTHTHIRAQEIAAYALWKANCPQYKYQKIRTVRVNNYF